MLYRKIANKIEYELKNSNKIIIVEGARQIGKTFIVRQVGKKLYKHFNEINLSDDINGDRIFDKIRNVQDFELQLGSMFGNNLGNSEDTLIFLDEIQVYPHMITMLKCLKEQCKYSIICSGSELGIALTETTSVPIGYINIIKMFPLDFEEFLLAINVSNDTIDLIKKCFLEKQSITESLHISIMKMFKEYLLFGGLPDAVNTFVKTQNIQMVRNIHDEIIEYYKIDASKYDNANKLKIRRIYELIPSALANTKKRIIINDIENIRGKSRNNYRDEFEYLIHSGIALNVEAISNPKFPLIQSQTKNLLKLYLNDVGLLTSIYYKYNIRSILDDDLSINLGSVYESVVAQELKAHSHTLYYYDNKKIGEVDFLVDDYDNLSVLPIEVKSGKNYRIHSALNGLLSNGEYNIKKAIVLSNGREVSCKNGILYMPIYYAMFI